MAEDMINRPPHYNREGAMETIDEMVLIFGIEETMSYCKLNAWKYRARALMKNGEEDLKKSDWYLKKYKELQDQSFIIDPKYADELPWVGVPDNISKKYAVEY